MAITRKDPNTIHVAGDLVLVDDAPAGEAGIHPGDMIYQLEVSGVNSWKRVASSADIQDPIFALERAEANVGLTTAYSNGDTIKAARFRPGALLQVRVPSGQTIARNAYLESNGGADAGTLKVNSDQTAAVNTAKFKAWQAYGAVTEETLVIVEVLGG